MEFLEKEIEDMIMEAPIDSLRMRGLPIMGRKFRQVRLGKYGVADIVFLKVFKPLAGIYHYNFEVVELKRGMIDAAAFWQAVRYIKGIQHWMSVFKPLCVYNIECSIIGKEIDTTNDFCFIPEVMPNIRLYTFDFSYQGIHFNIEEEYKIPQPNFTPHGKTK